MRRPRIALLGALASLASLVAVWAVADLAAFGRRLDGATLQGFVDLHSPRIDRLADAVVRLGDPLPFLVAGAVLVSVAMVRARPRTAMVVPLILLGANVTTQLLKPALASPRASSLLTDAHVSAASWPSGHATGAMSLALCAVIVSAPRWRPLVAALGGIFAVAVGYSTLILAWHLPSDVLGGFLVATVWTALGVAALWAAAARWPERAGRGREAALRVREAVTPSALTAVTATACAGALALARPDATLAYAQAHTVFVVGAVAIALLGATLAAALAVALRR
ncbi:MAG TPA: phosphatase PAP2 family protein [Solirubrobacteraceae bacterium]|nr:phosphatase PAP2 family protein [Solirubrobacteraceae bacterium]